MISPQEGNMSYNNFARMWVILSVVASLIYPAQSLAATTLYAPSISSDGKLQQIRWCEDLVHIIPIGQFSGRSDNCSGFSTPNLVAQNEGATVVDFSFEGKAWAVIAAVEETNDKELLSAISIGRPEDFLFLTPNGEDIEVTRIISGNIESSFPITTTTIPHDGWRISKDPEKPIIQFQRGLSFVWIALTGNHFWLEIRTPSNDLDGGLLKYYAVNNAFPVGDELEKFIYYRYTN